MGSDLLRARTELPSLFSLGCRSRHTIEPNLASTRTRRNGHLSTLQLVRQVRKLAWSTRLPVRSVQDRPRVVGGRAEAQPRLQRNA